ncbi:MAG: hypothetical protein E4H03_12890, partial [Myxococcales bacterium]
VHAMAVSRDGGRVRLHVNPDFFSTDPDSAAGVLLHEVHHVVQGHVDDESLREVEHRDLMQMAMEVAANDLVRECLPGTPVKADAFERFGVRPGLSTMAIYRLLAAARERGEEMPGLPGDSCSHVLVIDPDLDIEQLLDRYGPRRTAQLLRHAHAGLELSEIERLIQDDGRPPVTMDWRTAIRLMLPRTRSRRYTYRYPSRRAPNRLGEVPGRQRMTSRNERVRVLAAIDTSGSMTDPELAEIARQMAVLGRLANVTVVECNKQIQRVYPFRKKLTDVQGGGGTSYIPVFEPGLLRHTHTEAIVYFTDGQCRRYPRASPKVPTLWVLTEGGRFSCPWGKRARLVGSDRELALDVGAAYQALGGQAG